MAFSIATIGTLLLALAGPSVQADDESNMPWRLDKALHTPRWFKLSGHHRTRFETLDGQFRVDRSGNEHVLALRTALRMDIRLQQMDVTAEMMDSRQALAEEDTPLGTDIVNAFELIQGYVAFHPIPAREPKPGSEKDTSP